MKLTALLLLVIMLVPLVSQANGLWSLEKCYGHALWILQRADNMETDGNTSVGLGVDIQTYDTVSGGGQPIVGLNVSMGTNSRMGIRYDDSDNHGPLGWSWIDPSSWC